MAQITPQVSKVLEKALTLSTPEHGVFIDRLIESLDEDPPEEGVDAASSPTISVGDSLSVGVRSAICSELR